MARFLALLLTQLDEVAPQVAFAVDPEFDAFSQ
jgi:hypothetical protein